MTRRPPAKAPIDPTLERDLGRVQQLRLPSTPSAQTPARPDPAIPDLAEFEQWKAQQRGQLAGAASASSAGGIPDADEFEAWKRQGGSVPQYDYATGLMSKVNQGVTFGFADEISGAIDAGLDPSTYRGGSFKENYAKHRDRYRGIESDFASRNPKAAVAGEIAGAIAVPIGVGQAKGFAAGARGTQSLGRRILQSTGAGAAGGAAAGAGNANGDLAQRVRGAMAGGTIGAVAGGALTTVAAPIAAGARRLGVGRSADRRAQEMITERLGQDRITPEDLVTRARTLPAKPETIMDVAGENTRGLARAAQALPGRAKDEIRTALERRAEGTSARVAGDVESRLGVREDVFQRAEDLIQQRRQNAAPLYERAYQSPPIDDPRVLALFHHRVFQRAHRVARELAAVDGVQLPPLTQVTNIGGMEIEALLPQPIQTLDWVKRGLDAIIERGAGSESAMSRTEARIYRNRLEEALQRVDQLAPDYRAARQQFAGDSRMIEAFEAGADFLKDDARLTTRELARMTQGERELYTIRAVDEIRRAMDETGDGANVLRRIFLSDAKRARLRALFPSDAEFDAFRQQLEREARMADTHAHVLRGSPTARIEAEKDALAGHVRIGDYLNPSAMANRVAEAMAGSRARAYDEATSEALGRYLTAGARGDRDAFERLGLRLISHRGDAQRRAAAGTRRRTAAAVAGGTVLAPGDDRRNY